MRNHFYPPPIPDYKNSPCLFKSSPLLDVNLRRIWFIKFKNSCTKIVYQTFNILLSLHIDDNQAWNFHQKKINSFIIAKIGLQETIWHNFYFEDLYYRCLPCIKLVSGIVKVLQCTWLLYWIIMVKPMLTRLREASKKVFLSPPHRA